MLNMSLSAYCAEEYCLTQKLGDLLRVLSVEQPLFAGTVSPLETEPYRQLLFRCNSIIALVGFNYALFEALTLITAVRGRQIARAVP